MSEETIPPCPFCGGRAEARWNEFLRDMSMVRSCSCGAQAYNKKWAMRVSVNEIDNLRSRLKEANELICWNIDNFNDLPLPDTYYDKWNDKAKNYIRRSVIEEKNNRNNYHDRK